MSSTGLAATRPAQAAPAPTGPLRPRRRPWLAVASLLVMVVCGGTFVLIHRRADAGIDVLVLARPVTAGQLLEAQDVRAVHLVPAAGVDVVAAADAAQVLGHAAAVPLLVGSLLSLGEIGPVTWPSAGQAVVALPVRTERLADGVTAGSHVLVVEVAKDAGAQQPAAEQPAPVSGVVVSVRPGTDGSGTMVVSLVVARQDAVSVAGSGADLSVALAPE